MSSVFLNGLYTFGINSISSATNLILGGSNTNNIQILSPIIGNDNLSINCGNSSLLLDNSNITLDASNLTLDASNVTLNGSLFVNRDYSNIPTYSIGSRINLFNHYSSIITITTQNTNVNTQRFSNTPLSKGIWFYEFSILRDYAGTTTTLEQTIYRFFNASDTSKTILSFSSIGGDWNLNHCFKSGVFTLSEDNIYLSLYIATGIPVPATYDDLQLIVTRIG